MHPRDETGTKGLPEKKIIEVLEEDVSVGKVQAVTGRVRIQTLTETFEETVRETLQGETVEVERVAVDRIVGAVPEMRVENGVTILSVVEEILVVEKRLLLKEELHVRRRATAEDVEIPVTLRKQRAVVDRRPSEELSSNTKE